MHCHFQKKKSDANDDDSNNLLQCDMNTLIGNTDLPGDILYVDSTAIHKEVKGALERTVCRSFVANLKRKCKAMEDCHSMFWYCLTAA